jgi:hypothetical protein
LQFGCLSDAVFESGVRIEMNQVPGPFGPVRLVFSTKYSPAGEIQIPLSIEAEGLNLDGKTATQTFADLIRIFLRYFAVAANAPVYEVHLAEDLPAPEGTRRRRVLDFKAANGALRAFYDSPMCTWVGRAAHEYEMALRNNDQASETLMLAHLYQACLSLKQGLLAGLCQSFRCRLDQLPQKMRLEPDELDGYVNRQLIFEGRTDLFRTAYEANARHFFLHHPRDSVLWERRPVQRDLVRELALVVRGTLLRLAEIDDRLLSKLTAPPYNHPFSPGWLSKL